LAFIQHSDVSEVGTKTEINNKGLLGEGKIEYFYLDVNSRVTNLQRGRRYNGV